MLQQPLQAAVSRRTMVQLIVSSELATVVSGVGWTHKGGDKDDPWLSL